MRGAHSIRALWQAGGLLAMLAVSATAETVEVRAVEGLRFEPRRKGLAPGTRISLAFHNADSTDQPHNLLVLAPGKLHTVLQRALALGGDGPRRDFVPEGPEVLLASRLLKAGDRQILEWEVPAEPGIYPIVCTFPGHGHLMYGAFYVGVTPPPEAEDPNIPQVAETRRTFQPDPRPMVRRIFLPDAGPAAVAVALPGRQNFAWDAGACRLRHVWEGGFLDAESHFRSKGQGGGIPLGERWFKTGAGHPLRLGGRPPAELKFRGYRLHQKVPTFHYEADGQTVRERLTEQPDGSVLWEFHLPGHSKALALDLEGAEGGLCLSADGRPAGTVQRSGDPERLQVRLRRQP